MVKRAEDYDSWLDLPAGVYFEEAGNIYIKLEPRGKSGGIKNRGYSRDVCCSVRHRPGSSYILSFIAPEFFD